MGKIFFNILWFQLGAQEARNKDYTVYRHSSAKKYSGAQNLENDFKKFIVTIDPLNSSQCKQLRPFVEHQTDIQVLLTAEGVRT